MNGTLDRLLDDAALISDDEVRALALDEAERELCAAIVAREPRESTARPPRRRRSLRWGLPVLAGAAGAAVLAIALAGGDGQLGTSPERAWAAPALRVANAVPRLLIGEPGWTVTRADQFGVEEGEMSFADGPRGIDLHWRSGSFAEWVGDRARSADELAPAKVLGTTARVFRYRGPFNDYTALWRGGGYTMEFRTSYPPRLSLAEYRSLLHALTAVGVDDWLSAMPASVVLPTDTARTVEAMLAGVPLPPGLDTEALARDATVRDRYQLGARVAGAVACGWIERWVAARKAGDPAAAAAAAEAMQTSNGWPVLREMEAQGAYPEVLQDFASAIERGTAVPAGKPTNVEDHYREALGCERAPR